MRAPQRRRNLPLFFLALRPAPDPEGPAPGTSALPDGAVYPFGRRCGGTVNGACISSTLRCHYFWRQHEDVG